MILKTKKIEIIVAKEKLSALLERLQQLEIAEIISKKILEKENQKESSAALDFKLAKLSFARSFLKPYEKPLKFSESLLSSKEEFNLSELKELAKDKKIEEIVELCQQAETGINKLKARKASLSAEKEIFQKFFGITATKERKDALKNFKCVAGSVSEKAKPEFLKKIKEEKIVFSVEWAKKTFKGREIGFSLIYPQKKEKEVEEFLNKNKIKIQEIFWNKEPETLFFETEKELNEIEKKLEAHKEKAEKLAGFIPKIEALIDWYSWEREKSLCLNYGETTDSYFSILAWVPENSFDLLKREIEKISPAFLMREHKIEKDEKSPVIIKNNKTTSPFETVTNVYGAPKASDPDPTPYLAPFFALFFALILSDAGYGLFLLLAALAVKRIKKEKALANFLNLIALSGFLTIIAGVLTGTVFGTEIAAQYRILDPMKDPIKMMMVALFLGAFQLFVGLIIGMFWYIKNYGIKKGLSEKGANLFPFLGLGLFLLVDEIYIFLASLALMVLTKIIFSEERKLFLRVFSGFGSLYGLVGYFSDIISYSRILALGLATGVIAMVINVIAFLFKDMIPFNGLGWLVAIIVLIGGHFFNILINSLGAFIHSARLQFVEFFPKFMEGGGQFFKPLNKQGRFIKIINK